jgi:hypothetical protein
MKIAVSGYKCLNDINQFIELNDTTIITGKNSSGKSSFSEIFEFYSVFSDAIANQNNFCNWFEIKLNFLQYPLLSIINKGIINQNIGFTIAIEDEESNIRLQLNFKNSDDGFYIILNCLLFFKAEHLLLKIQGETHEVEVGNNRFEIRKSLTGESNLKETINSFDIKISNLVSTLKSYNNSKSKTKKNIFLGGKRRRNQIWFEEQTRINFTSILKDKSRFSNYLRTKKLKELSDANYDKIIELLVNQTDFTNAISNSLIITQELIHILYRLYFLFEEDFKETNCYDLFLTITSNEDLLKTYSKIKKINNLKEKFQFRIDKKNECFFSKEETNELNEFWNKEISGFHTFLIRESNFSTNEITDFTPIIQAGFDEDRYEIHLGGLRSKFPGANEPLTAFFQNSISNSVYQGMDIKGEIWHHAALDKNNYGYHTSTLWEAYLGIQHKIRYVEYMNHLYNPNPELDLITSLVYEELGNTILKIGNSTQTKNTFTISQLNFIDKWRKLNYKQKEVFVRTFDLIKRDNIAINTLIFGITGGKTIVFNTNENNNDIEIFLQSRYLERTNLTDEGLGHISLIGIILEITLQITSSLYSENPNNEITIILNEPEKYLHPDLCKWLIKIVYYFNIIDTIPIGKINVRPPFIKYIIETHSEYLIRNFQQQIASLKEFEEFNTITINYFEKQIEKNSSSIRQIYFENDGSLSDEFGSGFLDETELIIRNILNSRK